MMASVNANIVYKQETESGVAHPLKFMVWLFIVSVVMIFAALTSAYIVRHSEYGWQNFTLPTAFDYSTVIIVLSSVTMFISEKGFSNKNFAQFRLFYVLTMLFGFAFLVSQLYGWFYGMKLDLGGTNSNPSSSFLYVLSGLHGAHIILALLVLIVVFSIKNVDGKHGKYKLWMNLCSTFWHFLGVLWIYLYIFLTLNHNS